MEALLQFDIYLPKTSLFFGLKILTLAQTQFQKLIFCPFVIRRLELGKFLSHQYMSHCLNINLLEKTVISFF